MQVNDTKSIFETPRLEEVTKNEFLRILKSFISEGAELSWFTTDKHSFEWAEINENVRKFLQKIPSLEFNTVGIAVFYPKTKKMKYSSYKIVKSVK